MEISSSKQVRNRVVMGIILANIFLGSIAGCGSDADGILASFKSLDALS
jgi:hypothetical protein